MSRARLKCAATVLALALAGNALGQDAVGGVNAAPGWRALGDAEMRGVSAKGYAAPRFGQPRLPPAPAGARQGFGELEPLLNPLAPLTALSGFLSADVTLKDVRYGAGGGAAVWQRDGSVTLGLPAWIGEVDVRNVRPNGGDGNSFGSLRINALDLGRTTVNVAPK